MNWFVPRFPTELIPWQLRYTAGIPALERAWRDTWWSGVWAGGVAVSVAWLAVIVVVLAGGLVVRVSRRGG